MTSLPIRNMAATAVMAAMVHDNPVAIRRNLPPFTLRFVTLLDRHEFLIALCAGWVALLAPSVVGAAQFRVEPRLNVSETYTDNVGLTPPGREQSDFITQVIPGISIQGRSGKSEVFLDYSLQTLIYASDSGRNTLNHRLSTFAKTELIDDFLFFDAQASVFQQNTSLLGPIGLGFSNDNNNVSDVRTYSVTPIVRQSLGSTLSYEARYRHDYVGTDANSLSNSDSDKVVVAVKSGTAFSRIGWALNYSKEIVNYQASQDTRAESVSADIRYALDPRFALLTTVGYEKNDFAFIGPKPVGEFYDAGVDWQPSILTHLRATVGERFFGRTYFLDYSHRSRKFLWTARYSENIASTRSQLLLPSSIDTFAYLDALSTSQIPDPIQRARFVNDFIATRGLSPTLFSATNFFTNRTFLEKRFEASVALNTPKTTSILNVFQVDRSAAAIGAISTGFFGGDDFSTSTNLLQRGASVLFNWRFAAKTGVDLNTGFSNTLFRDRGREDNLKFIRVGLRQQLQPKVTGTVDYRHVQRDSDAASGNYKENALTAGITIRF